MNNSPFTEKELKLIRKRYQQLGQGSRLAESLGILGMEHASFLVDRLRRLMSTSNKITLEQYVNYLGIAMKGTKEERALMSFRFITQNQVLQYREFEMMLLDLVTFWNQITNSRVSPKKEYIQKLFAQLTDTDEVDFETFEERYEEIQIDWFDFFNTKTETVEKAPQLNRFIKQCQIELTECMNLLNDIYIQESHGPCNFSCSLIQKQGDEDPSVEDSILSKLQYISEVDPLDQILARIEQLDYLADQFHQRQTMRNRATFQPIQAKPKQQISVYFGHENWNLILNIMIGIRKAILAIQPEFYTAAATKQEFKSFYLHSVMDMKSELNYFLKDYAPSVFLRIRTKYQQFDYLRSIGPENLIGNLVLGKLNSLTELGSTGKSGSFFYFTQDMHYMIKTIPAREAKVFKRILPLYYQHMMTNDTLLSRIYGFHQLKSKQTKIYLIVIENLFQHNEIDFKYDIKGSLYGRKTSEVQRHAPLKDQDMLERRDYLRLIDSDRKLFLQQIQKDSNFLQSCDIIDYSLLIGYHKATYFKKNDAKSVFERYNGGMLSSDREYIYYVGVIDILTGFSSMKQFEFSVKSTFVSDQISCVPPDRYAVRFQEFIRQHCLQPTYLK